MNDPIVNFAHELRQRIYSAEFRCLSSFLHAVTEGCGARGAGVVSIHKGKVFGRRTVGDGFERIRPILERKLVGTPVSNARNVQPIGHDTSRDALGEWVDDEYGYLLLRRIWPASSWMHRADERFWLYVLNPRFVMAPKFSAGTASTDQFGGLISAFIRWKNEVLAHHDELLTPPLADPRIVLSELGKLLVRPVLPTHFHAILVRSTPKDPDAKNWTVQLDSLLKTCRRDECRCEGGPDNAVCPGRFACPQTPAIDLALGILTALEKWRTEFWKSTKHREIAPDERVRLVRLGLDGLRDAAVLLHSQPDWMDETKTAPINFSEGAIGLAGERALLRHFCARAIDMALAQHRTDWEDPRVHSAQLEFPAKLASLASTLIGDGRWTPDAIKNLLQVVALFGHRVLEIPARIDLVRHLRQTLRGETALHTLKSRYRDHFFHTVEVCFMGFALLNSCPRRDGRTLARTLVDRCLAHGTPAAPPLSEAEAGKKIKELFAQWWTAALVHDTAYGIDIFDGTLSLLDFFSNRKDIREFVGRARATVADLAKSLQDVAPELKRDPSLKKGDHGVIAAASLAETLAKIGPETAVRFQPAVRAIAFHNTRHPKVNAGQDPVAALLIMCDTVQEWGRSSLGFDRSPSVLLSRMMEASLTPPEEQFGPVKRYGLSLIPDDTGGARAGEYVWHEPGKLLIELDYGPEALRECRAKFIWADMTYNLQRVDFRPWDLNLRIEVSTPPPQSGEDGKQSKSQFEHFGDFVAEQEVRFAERWLRIASERDTDQAVSYCEGTNGAGKREKIQFNLQEMSRQYANETPLMGGTIGDFSKALTSWPVYTREQAEAPPLQNAPV